MTNSLSLMLAAGLLVGGTTAAFAQADTRAAPGVFAPNLPRVESNGDISPAPSRTVTGGVGATEISTPTKAQSLTGGPSGGNGRSNGGG